MRNNGEKISKYQGNCFWIRISIRYSSSVSSRFFSLNLCDYQVVFIYRDLSGNEISLIEMDSFANFTNLKILDLSQNLLKQIDDSTFGELDHLETVKLAQNQIVHIFSGSFESLKNLKQMLVFLINNSQNEIIESIFSSQF